jgi:hypothetical protein
MRSPWIARIGVLLVAVVTGSVMPMDAAALEAKAASSLVSVFGNLNTPCAPGADSIKLIDQKQNGDGTITTFVVPNNQVFVVTGFHFTFDGVTPSRNIKGILGVVDAAITSVSTVGVAVALADSTGSGGGSLVLPSGFPVKAGARLCWAIGATPTIGAGMHVHGHLAPDR